MESENWHPPETPPKASKRNRYTGEEQRGVLPRPATAVAAVTLRRLCRSTGDARHPACAGQEKTRWISENAPQTL